MLAHLSRRLTRWSYSMVPRPSIVHTFELDYLWGQLANLDQYFCITSLGWVKGCISFLRRFDQNPGFHGNRKYPLTYNGENNVSTPTPSVLIQSSSNLQVTRTGIKSWMSSNFNQIETLPMELGALEHLKNFTYTYNGKMVSPSELVHFFIRTSSNLMVTRTCIKFCIQVSSNQTLWSYVPLRAD